MSASRLTRDSLADDNAEDLLHPDDAAEEILQDDDHLMEDEDENDDDNEEVEEDDSANIFHEELDLQNDSSAHFDSHTDSVFCLAQHPLIPSLIASGGGDDCAYLFDSSLAEEEPGPVLPTSYESQPRSKPERPSISPRQRLDGHTDSVNALVFSQPSGDYLVTAGLDGKLRAWSSSSSSSSSSPMPTYTFLAEASEVQEINWLCPCPSPSHPNSIAFGASDGSVWVYIIDSEDTGSALSISQAYYLHTESCTAGCWTPDGKLLATVSEDSSLYVYDVWGEVASAGTVQAVISLTAADQRFAVQGGLYSIAISPGGSIAAVGGAEGQIRIISLPRLNSVSAKPSLNTSDSKRRGKPSTSHESNPASSSSSSPFLSSTTQAGTLLASLTSQSDSIETLSFSAPPLTLLASGSVDGTIALFDVAHRFALRRQIRDAHSGFAVVQLEFLRSIGKDRDYGFYLTSAGMDGTIKRWDGRGINTAAPGSTTITSTGTSATEIGQGHDQDRGHDQGLVREWKGHRGDGEGGGVLAFVQCDGERIVSAGDDGVVLVFRDDPPSS